MTLDKPSQTNYINFTLKTLALTQLMSGNSLKILKAGREKMIFFAPNAKTATTINSMLLPNRNARREKLMAVMWKGII